MDAALALVVIGAIILLIRHSTRSSASTGPLWPEDIYRWPNRGEFDFEIVGESHYQPALRQLAGEHGDESPDREYTAMLVPEHNNPHDGYAVRVVVEGMTVGYLPRDDARSFRRRLSAKNMAIVPTCCAALIVGGFRLKNGLRAHYGVKLDINPFNN